MTESLRDVPEPPTEWRKLNQNVPLWECPVCRATVSKGMAALHAQWHERNEGQGLRAAPGWRRD